MATNNATNYKPAQYNVQVGGANGTLTNVVPAATSGVPVISAGSSANPTFGTAVVAGGGTGITAAGAAYAPICAGTSTTGAFQTASTGIATSGFVLTSNGSSTLPSWQASGSTITLTGDTGGALTSTSFTLAGAHGLNTAGASTTLTFAIDNDITLGDITPISAGSPALTATTGDIVLTAGNLSLPLTAADGSAGIIMQGVDTLLQTLGLNLFLGDAAGNLTLDTDAANFNVGIGSLSLSSLTEGGSNSALGKGALSELETGSLNCALGTDSGSNYTTSESNNITISNLGTASDSGVIRVGTNGTHTSCFIAGIDGVNVGSVAKVVTEASDQLGTATLTPGSNISITPGANTITIAATGLLSSISITGNSGGALTGSAFTFTGGTSGLTFSGSGTTETLTGTLVPANGGTGATTLTGLVTGNGTSTMTASAITQHDVLVGGASNAVTSVAPSATSGVPLISQGATSDPAFGTAVVAGGGTGVATMTTAYAPVCAGTTATGALQVASTGLSSSGFILTSTGASSLPTFQAPAASSISITGNTGGALTGSSFTFSGGSTGLSFGGSGTTETLTFAGITANGGTVSLATDATTSTVNIGTGLGVKTCTFGSQTSSSGTEINGGTNGIDIISANGDIIMDTGTGTVNISTDATVNNVNLGTGAAAKVVTVGSTTSNATTTIQSGAGAGGFLFLNSNGGVINIASGTGDLDISTQGSACNVNLGTGAAAKTVIVGSSNTTSSTTIQSGSGNITLSSPLTTISGGNLNIPTTASSSVGVLEQNATSLLQTYGANNLFLGTSSGNFSLTTGSAQNNVGVGPNCLASLTTSANNTALGSGALSLVSSSAGNTAVGLDALSSLATGSGSNTAVGVFAGQQLLTGTNNTLIGYFPGYSYTGSESNNICVSNQGTTSDSGVIRIGTNSTHTSCYVQGISGTSVSNLNYVTINTSTGQMGSTSSTGTTKTSWTPGLSFGGGTTGLTYTTQAGYYTQVGNIVYYSLNIVINAAGISTGSVSVTGFPVTSANLTNITYPAAITASSVIFTGAYLVASKDNNSTTMSLFVCTSATSSTALTNAAFTTGSQIVISGFYFV